MGCFAPRSFAFYTVKERMPVIVTNLIDTLVRTKEHIAQEYGEVRICHIVTNLGQQKLVSIIVFKSSCGSINQTNASFFCLVTKPR